MKKLITILMVAFLPMTFSCRNDPSVTHPTSECSSISGYEVVTAESPLDNTSTKQLQVTCPGNKFAIGAGWSVEDPTSAILEGEATYFQPSYDGKSWLVNAKNNSTFAPNWKLRVRCLCADVCNPAP